MTTPSTQSKKQELEGMVNLEDLKIDIYRHTGAGVNESSRAVRVTYKPLQISVHSEELRTHQENLEWCCGALIDAINGGYV